MTAIATELSIEDWIKMKEDQKNGVGGRVAPPPVVTPVGIPTPPPTGAPKVFDSEKFATGTNPTVGGQGNPGVGGPAPTQLIQNDQGYFPAPTPAPRGPLASYVPNFDRNNRDAYMSGVDTFRNNAATAGYTPQEIEDYWVSNLSEGFNPLQRQYYQGQGEGLVRNALRSRLGSRYDQYAGDVDSELTNYAYMNRPTIDTARGQDILNIPQNLYGESGVNKIYEALNNRVRGKAMTDFQTNFKTNPYQEIDDTADDDIVNRVVDEQYGKAREGVDRQVKRGSLNTFGRDNAYRQLDTRKGQVTSRLQDRGKGLLDALRGKAQGIYDSAQTGASGASVENPYDVNNFSSQYRSTIDSGRAGLEGSFRDQVAPDEFSVQDIVGGAATAQGATNKSAPILAAIEARGKLKSNNRGLGTVGAF